MLHARARTLFSTAIFTLALVASTLAFVSLARPAFARQPGAVAEQEPAAGVPQVPPLPEGTPAELMKFIEGLRETDYRPNSRQEMMAYMKQVATVSVQAADKILGQGQAGVALHNDAALL